MREILSAYNLKDAIITPINSGLINNSFTIDENFILQCINTKVFMHPLSLFDNALKIQNHLQNQNNQGYYPYQVSTLKKTIDNSYFYVDKLDYWRMFDLIPSITLTNVKNADIAFLAANAFGCFIDNIQDLKLAPTIANLHNLTNRLNELKNSCAIDIANRYSQCTKWLNFIKEQPIISEYSKLEHIELRNCHLDTKVSNLLFAENLTKCKAVIDLDTTQQGFLMCDFGDMVRSMAPNVNEDSTNFLDIEIEIDKFKAISDGFLTAVTSITKHERQTLLFGVKLIPFILGIRFLTDYLNKDIYFNTSYPEHNLDRAINQLSLYKNIIAKEKSLAKIITK